jgi:hypothetical protein
MGRPLKYAPGQKVAKGKIEIIEVVSQGAGKRAKAKIFCSLCNKSKIVSTGHLHKMRSCGCMRHDSSLWRRAGAQNRSWQLPPGEAAFNQLYYSYANRADKRGFEFLLSKEDFRQIIVKPCIYCGSIRQNRARGLGKTSGDFLYTGIDRRENTCGYVIKNCVPCCSRCNWMKHAMQQKDFLSHVAAIVKHQALAPVDA